LSVAAVKCKVARTVGEREMSIWYWLPVAFAAFMLSSVRHEASSQPLAVNPTAAASDVSNPSSTSPSAAASDIRDPSATNPSASASQIPQPPALGIAPGRTLTPALVDERVRVPPRRARTAQATDRRAKPRQAADDHMTRPFEALEGARRDRIEMEKRVAQEKANEARAAREQKAKDRAEAKRGAAQKPETNREVTSLALQASELAQTRSPRSTQDRTATQSPPPSTAKEHRVIIQVTQNDPGLMNMALNNAQNLTRHYEEKGESVAIEFVAYGPGLHMLRSDTSPVKDRLSTFALQHSKAVFSGCGNTLDNQRKQENKEISLVSEARMVQTGIARVMELQEAGWAYVRP
jgi:uncharacterized protein